MKGPLFEGFCFLREAREEAIGDREGSIGVRAEFLECGWGMK